MQIQPSTKLAPENKNRWRLDKGKERTRREDEDDLRIS